MENDGHARLSAIEIEVGTDSRPRHRILTFVDHIVSARISLVLRRLRVAGVHPAFVPLRLADMIIHPCCRIFMQGTVYQSMIRASVPSTVCRMALGKAGAAFTEIRSSPVREFRALSYEQGGRYDFVC